MPRDITISLELLRDLMFDFNSLAEIRAQSVTDAGPEVYAPKIVPKELGKIIEALNTDDLFVIFHFDHHSEIWHKGHWADSNSRRWLLITKANASIVQWNERMEIESARLSKLRKIKDCICAAMPAFADKAMESNLHNMAIALSKAPRELTDRVPGLTDIMYPTT
jgi:hypothetical protein